MGKFIIKRAAVAASGIFFTILFFGVMFNACKEAPTQAEKVYLDTLYYKLKGNEKALNIDEQKLLQRKEIIRNDWLPSVKDTASDVRAHMEGDFRGMLTAYDFYLDRHLLYKASTQILLDDLQEFKRKTDGKEIDREEFKIEYKELNSRVEDNTRDIEVIAKPIYELEPMWLRYTRMMKMRNVKTLDE